MNLAPHPFTLRQLQYIVAVAEELSFRRASARCGVSQPSLSAQVAQVESALDVRLFERAQKRVLVTAAGRAFVDRARCLLVDADELARAARVMAEPLAGTIRLGIIPTISPYLLPPVTPALRDALPKLRIAWVEEKTDVLVGKLGAGEIDGAVLALEADIGRVEHAVVASDPLVLVTRKDHPLAAKQGPVTDAELRGEELLLLDEGHCFRDQAIEACGTARAKEGSFRATSLSTLVQMVAGGGGITLIPAIAIDAEARRARLRTRPLASRSAHRTIAVIWRKGAALEPALSAIATVLREAYPPVSGAGPRIVPRRARQGRRARIGVASRGESR